MNVVSILRNKYKYELSKIYKKSNLKKLEKSKIDILSIHNYYEGKRCFVIGNGPSLCAEDLIALKDEITFASNGIYYMYDRIDWRPTFFCVQDYKFICNRYEEINKFCGDSVNYIGIVNNRKYPKLTNNTVFVNLDKSFESQEYPNFSKNICECIYEGLTVTYFNIQLAVYMGFKEIYLIGVDHNYSGPKSHFSEKDKCDNEPRLDKTTIAYIKAKQYADKNGINIYNATRGGNLDVFERKNIEEIIKDGI